MGTRDPDNVRLPPSPLTALSVGEMRAAGWTLRGTCSRCKIQTHVDLSLIVAAKGPDYVIWGRKTRCKVWAWGDDERCGGQVAFEARSIRGGSWRALTMSGEVQDALRLRSVAGQRR